MLCCMLCCTVSDGYVLQRTSLYMTSKNIVCDAEALLPSAGVCNDLSLLPDMAQRARLR
jgi:hypothetical protein